MLPLFYILLVIPIRLLNNFYSTYICVYFLVENIIIYHGPPHPPLRKIQLYNFSPSSTHKKTNPETHSHEEEFNLPIVYLPTYILQLLLWVLSSFQFHTCVCNIYLHFFRVIMTVTDDALLYIIMYRYTYTHTAQQTYIFTKPPPGLP